jgi:phosphoribosylaminoimidazolecarboxamide formyltransferase/IMP cyclohydrolase
VLDVGDLTKPVEQLLEYKSVAGGLLVQTRDTGAIAAQDLRVVTKRQPTAANSMTCCLRGALPST